MTSFDEPREVPAPAARIWSRRAVLALRQPTDLFNVVAIENVFPYPEGQECERQEDMAIQLTPEQERRVQGVLNLGAYESVEEVVDAALPPSNSAPCRALPGRRKNLTPCWRRSGIKGTGRRRILGSVNARTDILIASVNQARFREGLVSAGRQRRSGAPVSLLPRYPESARRCPSLSNGCKANRSITAIPPPGGPTLSFQQPPASKIFAPGRSRDLRPSAFITSWMRTNLRIVRILHGKRDVKRILEGDQGE